MSKGNEKGGFAGNEGEGNLVCDEMRLGSCTLPPRFRAAPDCVALGHAGAVEAIGRNGTLRVAEVERACVGPNRQPTDQIGGSFHDDGASGGPMRAKRNSPLTKPKLSSLGGGYPLRISRHLIKSAQHAGMLGMWFGTGRQAVRTTQPNSSEPLH